MDDTTTDTLTAGHQIYAELNDMTPLEEAIRAGHFNVRGE